MASMRVLQAMAGSEYGGAEAFFTRLVTGLASHGIEQHVLMRPNAGRESTLKKAGINPVLMKFGGRFDLFTQCIESIPEAVGDIPYHIYMQ